MKEIYGKIYGRAKQMGIAEGMDGLSFMMDLESADRKFNLRLDDLLTADSFDFQHDITGICSHIDRSEFPATNFNMFVPRFAGRE